MKKIENNHKVIVIGGEHHNTLGVIRALGLAGIYSELILITNTKYTSVKKSKFISKYVCVHEDTGEVLNALNGYKGYEDKPILIPTSDFAALVIDRNLNELKKYFIAPSVGDKQGEMEKYMDKYNQYLLSKENGIKMAETYKLDLGKDFGYKKFKNYPYILKPLVSAINGSKDYMRICKSERELKRAVEELRLKGFREVLLQEYLKYDYEVDIAGCAYNDNIIIPGIIKKKRRYPAGNGTTSLGTIEKVPDDFLSIRKLVSRLKLQSLFDIELFYKDGEYYLCEINFRNSGLSYAYTYGGVNLPYLYIRLTSNQQINNVKTSAGSAFYFRDENGERRLLMHGNISLREYLLAKKKSVGLVFDKRDIMPDIYRWVYAAKKRIFRGR